MKKPFILIFILLNISSGIVFAKEHCDPSYKGKSFHEVVIWSGVDGFGPAECFYGDKKVSYFYAKGIHYKVSGNWQSTMPGYQWCSLETGGDYSTCLFAIKEVNKK